ncbi:PREDICTED: uncharacterized protein LOC109158007 [Ipomoea nil]|uniref:uncharacterized protein LOC109158007 n=1 Tax=Ipomoea nil TaxID=35883 RepID=UPI00090178B9|nr:PREDICTED: uncharacterized protein LOC109158007 [Ipomoea nil]
MATHAAATAATTVEGRTRAMWRMRLQSAARTALTCTIVGCATLYISASLRTHVFPFPAFSYLTAILIVSDATLGDALRGCCHALYATLQVMPLSMLGLWVAGGATLSPGIAAAMVVLASYVVALPESTHIMSKRIAFGQLVIVFVDAVVHGVHTSVIVHPLRVAPSTALGALASLLALIFPLPRLAYFEVKKLYKLYTKNASERIALYSQAVAAGDTSMVAALTSQAKPLAETGAKLLESIGLLQEGLKWEKPWLKLLNPSLTDPAVYGLEEIETSLRGMEIALSTYPSFHSKTIDEELLNILQSALEKLGLKIEQARGSFPCHKRTAPGGGAIDMSLPYASYFLTHEDLPASFFFSCLKMFINGSATTPDSNEGLKDSENQQGCSNKWSMAAAVRNERMIFACKCSFSLGLAVLFGLLFDRAKGYWSGLTIAISFETGKQAIFTLANARAQGTALGSIYGVLGSTLFQRISNFKIISLLPWIIFTSFLRHSRMYGQAGGISAAIGALLILGRKDYGPPKEFAIERLTEAFIGLSCFISMELLFQPTRAAFLAKYHLHTSLEALKKCTEHIVLDSGKVWLLREKQWHLKSQVLLLGKFISQAELEPDFWSLPFPVSCYQNLHKSLAKITDLLYFMACNIQLLSQALQSSNNVAWKEIQEHINKDLELYMETITSLTSSLTHSADSQEKKHPDLEEGTPNPTTYNTAEKTLNSFLEHCKEVTEKLCELGVKDEQRAMEALHMFAVGFCSRCLMEELAQVDKGIKELVQYRDP